MSTEDDALEKTAYLGGRRASAAAPSPPRLIVIDGPCRGRILDVVKAEAFLGRKDDCDLVLASNSVSKRHARVALAEGVALLEDLRSTNGVRVNGRLLEPAAATPLCHGDLVEISDHRLLYLDDRASGRGDAFLAPLDRGRIATEVDALFADFSPPPTAR